jgi:diguanylate cyclase (GGDEF)-like protein
VVTHESQYQQLLTEAGIVALLLQITAAALIALLSYIISRAVRSHTMRYWTGGWACYAAALCSILLAFRVGSAGPAFVFAYFALEYAAIILIFAACRLTATTWRPRGASWLALLPAAAVAGALLVPAQVSFYWPFAIHSGIIGLGWAACLVVLFPALRAPGTGPGVHIVAAGLALLCLDYLQHVPTALYAALHHLAINPNYYTVTGLIDGMLEFVLGLGTVVVIVDEVRGDLERANAHLRVTHERAERALHTEPVTGALTRYSFDVTFRNRVSARIASGAVIVVDLDGLKRLNDTLGHAAGDAALRAVAAALRALLRSDDLVYRWGGDEFVVVMVGAAEALARTRMWGLNEAVNRCARLIEPASDLGELTVSHGVAAFGKRTSIESAIAEADATMYSVKSARALGWALRAPDAQRSY